MLFKSLKAMPWSLAFCLKLLWSIIDTLINNMTCIMSMTSSPKGAGDESKVIWVHGFSVVLAIFFKRSIPYFKSPLLLCREAIVHICVGLFGHHHPSSVYYEVRTTWHFVLQPNNKRNSGTLILSASSFALHCQGS